MQKSESPADSKARARVLKALRKRKQRALHASEVRGRIGWDRTRHAEVLQLLDQLADQGLVSKLPGERYQALPEPRVHRARAARAR